MLASFCWYLTQCSFQRLRLLLEHPKLAEITLIWTVRNAIELRDVTVAIGERQGGRKEEACGGETMDAYT